MSIGHSYRRGFGEMQQTDELGTHSYETYTCAHCNTVHRVDPQKSPPVCFVEFLPICMACHAKNKCTPFEKKLQAYESRAAMFRSMGL